LVLFGLLFLGVVFSAAPEITQLSYNPAPAVPGSTIDLFLQIENTDIAKSDVMVSIIDEFPFSVKDDSSKLVGDMIKHAKSNIVFKIYVDPSAENKTYSIKVNVSTKDEVGKIVPLDVVVSGKEPIVKVVQISPSKLVPGEEKQISMVLQNVGTSAAYDVIVELQEDRTVTTTGAVVDRQILPLGSATTYVGEIFPGLQKTLTMGVSVNRDADLKNYIVPVTVSYRTAAGVRESSRSYIGFKVSGNVDFESTMREIVGNPIAGESITTTLELFNKGAGKADFVVASITTDCGVVDDKKEFIGSLEPNDIDSFRSTIVLDDNLDTGFCEFNVNIEYQDIDASTKKVSIPIALRVYSKEDGNQIFGSGPNWIILFGILIILGAGVWYYKKRFHNKK